jgi:L-lactate dehydrogenase complex protein LldF
MEQKTSDHAILADKFNQDIPRVDWHDKTLWFIREKREIMYWTIFMITSWSLKNKRSKME